MSLFHGLRTRVRLLFGRRSAESRMEEELRFHLEMEAARLVRERELSPAEARRRACVAFGGRDKYRDEMRAGRGLAWLSGLRLDMRLGARMLVKYPGLTVVGGLGMAVAITIGAVFASAAAVYNATLPFEHGDRVVAIENWDTERNNQERRIQHDFQTWRNDLRTVEDLAAYRIIRRNLIVPSGPAEPVVVAEMTAAGFRVAGVPPLLGRPLVAADELEGSPLVMVIGHDVWETRFGSAPSVVGRTVGLGSRPYTVVGVMPEGFKFPVNRQIWVPLRLNRTAYEQLDGPSLWVFGRLADGATIEEAQAELAILGRRAAVAFPGSHARLQPRVVRYTAQVFDDMEGWEIPMGQFLVLLLLAVVCANVAILVYARTATRLGEIAVRGALGASRRRILGQLFAEALALAGAAAATGLGIAGLVLRQADAVLAPLGLVPFWVDVGLSVSTVANVTILVVVAAVIVGLLPALPSTGRQLQSTLHLLAGGTGPRLGNTWTALIVAQVAFAVAALPATAYYAGGLVRYGMADPGFAADEYLTASLVLDEDTPSGIDPARQDKLVARFALRQVELLRRLEADDSMSEVTVASALPGAEPTVLVDIDGVPATIGSASGHAVRTNHVDLGFFETFEVLTLAGRRFRGGDRDSTATGVIVNRAFAQRLLGGDALGHRFRYVEGYRSGGRMHVPAGVVLGRWYEIVGVVGDLPPRAMGPGGVPPGVYHALAPGKVSPVSLVLRNGRAPTALSAQRLRDITTALDPALRLGPILSLDAVLGRSQTGMRLGGLALGLIALSVLLLSAAGIYALMSCAVVQRRREIGIRVALGAPSPRVLVSILSRAARQLGVGVGVGAGAGALLLVGGGIMGGQEAALLLLGMALVMTLVGLIATIGPARRSFRIQPTEALREE